MVPQAREGAGLEELRGDLDVYADDLGLSRCHLLGHSMRGHHLQVDSLKALLAEVIPFLGGQ